MVLALPVCNDDPTTEPEGNDIALFYFKKNVGPRVKMFGTAAESFYLAATASADDAILEVRRGAALGVASLDAGTKVPVAQISEVTALADLSDVTAKTGTGTTVVMNAAPSITSPDITTSITMASDNNVDIGTATKRVKTISVMSGAVKVFNASADANAVLTLGNASITFGAGGASAQDARFYRSGAAGFTIDNGGGGAGSLTVMGDLTVQGTTTTINSTVVDIKDRVIHMNHDTGTGTAIPALAAGFSIHRGAVGGASRGHAAMLWINDSDKVSAASGTGCFIVCDNPAGDDSTVGTLLPFRCGTLYIGVNSRFILSESGLGSACTFTIYNKGGEIVTVSGTQTLTNKTLTTPTISATGWTNANHAHTAANSGGQLTPTTCFASTTGSGTTVVLSGNPTLTAPVIGSFVNATHTHSVAAGGGQLTGAAFSTTTGSGTTVVLSAAPTIANLRASTIFGGTTSAATITIRATSHTSPGSILLCASGSTIATINQYGVGVLAGVANASFGFYLKKDQNGTTYGKVENSTNGALSCVRFTVQSDSAQTFLFANSTTTTPGGGYLAKGAGLSSYLASALQIVAYDSAPITFSINGSERARITINGDLLVGTTTDSYLAYFYQAANAQQQCVVENPSNGTLAAAAFTTAANSIYYAQLYSTSPLYTPVSGKLASDGGLFTINTSTLSIVTGGTSPIRFVTNTVERARWLGTANTLQGNAGFTLEAGAASGCTLTLRGAAVNAATNLVAIGGTLEKVSFWGATGSTRPTAYTQTYSTATKTHANDTAADISATGATQTTPWGYGSEAQANDVATQFNLLRDDVDNVKQVVNQIIDDLQGIGILQ
jgi:hypothetical protein